MSRCRNESRADCEKQIRPVCLVRVHSANNQPNTYALFHQPALYSQLLPFTAAAWYNTTPVIQGFYALLKGTWTIASKGVQFFSSSMMFQSQKATHTWKNVGWVSWNWPKTLASWGRGCTFCILMHTIYLCLCHSRPPTLGPASFVEGGLEAQWKATYEALEYYKKLIRVFSKSFIKLAFMVSKSPVFQWQWATAL